MGDERPKRGVDGRDREGVTKGACGVVGRKTLKREIRASPSFRLGDGPSRPKEWNGKAAIGILKINKNAETGVRSGYSTVLDRS
jgi:hypothetical protein